ncbi:hypothetical protein C8R44DRAFT_878231 [Mycena epipterygia]|nr:hypothetical protein C8R44DRAFT_878231 [Mycena epipterygia]
MTFFIFIFAPFATGAHTGLCARRRFYYPFYASPHLLPLRRTYDHRAHDTLYFHAVLLPQAACLGLMLAPDSILPISRFILIFWSRPATRTYQFRSAIAQAAHVLFTSTHFIRPSFGLLSLSLRHTHPAYDITHDDSTRRHTTRPNVPFIKGPLARPVYDSDIYRFTSAA